MLKIIKSDLAANKKNIKGQLVVVLFRMAHALRCNGRGWMIVGLPYLCFYRFFVEWILGIEIPPLTKIGEGLVLNHGQGLVINHAVILGKGCRLRQGVTLGNKASDPGCPLVGDNVEFGANAVVVGSLVIGDNAVIGACSVVTEDVEPYSVVGGVPARVIKVLDSK